VSATTLSSSSTSSGTARGPSCARATCTAPMTGGKCWTRSWPATRRGVRRYFRADAAFAKPEVYEYLEERRFLYTIRLPSNEVLDREIGNLLKRPAELPVIGRPITSYDEFRYQAGNWDRPRRVVAKVEWHQGELFPRVGFIVTNMSASPEGVVGITTGAGRRRRGSKRASTPLTGPGCPATGSWPTRCGCGSLCWPTTWATCCGGWACPRYQGVVATQRASQAHQDRWTVGAPCQKVGVSACRSDYDQGCVQRGTGADKQTLPTARIVLVRDLGVDLR